MASSNTGNNIDGVVSVKLLWGNDLFHEQAFREQMMDLFKHDRHSRKLLHLSATDDGTITVRAWDSYTCQGQDFGDCTFILTYSPPCDKMVSTQTTSSESSATRREFLKQQFETLFGVVVSLDVANPFLIGPLGHDLAVDILYRKLLMRTPRPIEKLEIIAKDHGDDKGMGRALKLCCMLVANNSLPTLKRLFVENLRIYDNDDLIQKFIQALESNTCLEELDIKACRYIHTWNKGRKIWGRPDKEGVARLSFAPLILSMCAKPNSSLRQLDLSGNLMSDLSPSKLTADFPKLKLKSLFLRDTGLNEAALLEIARSLKDDTVLQELDLSHNDFTQKVTEVLCDSLKENITLERLTMDHCNLDWGQAQFLADSLPDIKGLKHWSLDGNDFTWNPVRNNCISIGATLLINALEHNHTLLSLSVGQHDKIYVCIMSCCTTPPYSRAVSEKTELKFQRLLKRNQEYHQEYCKAREREGILWMASFLLSKMQQPSKGVSMHDERKEW